MALNSAAKRRDLTQPRGLPFESERAGGIILDDQRSNHPGAYMQRTFIVSAFLLGAITFTQAEDTKEMAAMGWGIMTCAVFANMYRGDPEFAEEHSFNWAQGFMSGLNFAAIGNSGISMNLHSMSTDQQRRAIRAYCNDHPLANYVDAVLDVYGRFSMNKPVQRQN
jgi:hypothetical protein